MWQWLSHGPFITVYWNLWPVILIWEAKILVHTNSENSSPLSFHLKLNSPGRCVFKQHWKMQVSHPFSYDLTDSLSLDTPTFSRRALHHGSTSQSQQGKVSAAIQWWTLLACLHHANTCTMNGARRSKQCSAHPVRKDQCILFCVFFISF